MSRSGRKHSMQRNHQKHRVWCVSWKERGLGREAKLEMVLEEVEKFVWGQIM